MKNVKIIVIIFILIYVSCAPVDAAFPRQRLQLIPFRTSSELLLKAVVLNPVTITQIDGTSAQVSYANLYGIRQLQDAVAAISQQFGKTYYGIGFTRFGNDNYNENTISALFGMLIQNAGRVGIGLHGYQLAIDGYGEARSWGVDLGTRWRLTEKISWEIAYTNLNNPTIGISKDPLPQQIYTAVHYHPVPQINSEFLLQQNIRYLPQFGFGMEYQIFPWIAIAGNISTEPVKSSAGIHLHWHGMQIQYVFSFNASQLPATHRFGVGFIL